MPLSPVAKRYAQAVFALGHEQNNAEVVLRDFLTVERSFKECPELKTVISLPSISSSKRLKILEKCFENVVGATTQRFFQLLAAKNRLKDLPDIISAYKNIYEECQNVLHIVITSPGGMDSDQIKNLTHHLQLAWGKEIHYDLRINPDLLGGLMIQVGDKIYDYSFRNRLERFQHSLTSAVAE